MPDVPDRISIADSLLLEQVLAGDEDGWRAVVGRYGPRLTAFANNRMGKSRGVSAPEDVVQETFVSFLKSASTFRGDCSLESYLFRILRYRINDHFRKSSGTKELFWSPFSGLDGIAPAEPPDQNSITASRYVRQGEQLQSDQTRMSDAIFLMTDELRRNESFRDLKIAEGLFFVGLKNRQLAEVMDVSANEVAVVKHRLLARLKGLVADDSNAVDDDHPIDQHMLPDLQAIWLDQRPSCPKRTTLGKFSLEILPQRWRDFVHFHVNVLGCGFCQANLTEITQQDLPANQTNINRGINEALFQSTIGFLPK